MKEGKDLYTEIQKTWMKEIEDVTNKWKYTLSSWIEIVNILKMTQIFFQKGIQVANRHINRCLNFINYQENANQNTKKSCHILQNGC